MSQYPPPPPMDSAGYPIDYAPQPKTSGTAMASMILGIISIPLLCIGVGVITAIVALVMGIVALSAINKNPQLYGGKGMAITGIATAAGSFVLVPLMIAILLPSLGKSRELANRSTCAANLRGITQSMNVYAADGDVYPVAAASYSSTLASALPGPNASPDDLLSNKPGMLYAPGNPGNVCQSMWIMVIDGQVASKQFICKSDATAGAPSPASVGGGYRSNFSDDKSYSYSFAFMWANGGTSMGGWWHSDTDASLPLIADMAPANGSGSPAANTLNGTNKNANSFNHQRDGQNIGFGDGHAEFARLANVGPSSDNIYSANGNGGPSQMGTTPSSAADPGIRYSTTPAFGGSKGNWDVCLVPAADGASGTRR